MSPARVSSEEAVLLRTVKAEYRVYYLKCPLDKAAMI